MSPASPPRAFTLPERPPPELDLDDSKPLSTKKSDIIITVTSNSTDSLTLPLRPTFRDRFWYLYLKTFPNETYTPLLIRRRNFAALCLLLPPLLIFIIIIAVTCSQNGRRPGKVGLPRGRQIYAGDGTYYHPALGACGRFNGDGDMVVAVAWQLFDSFSIGSDPNQNPVCGRKVRARRAGQTEGVEMTIVDRCTGCQPQDLDLSPKAFNMLGQEVEGRIRIEWSWV